LNLFRRGLIQAVFWGIGSIKCITSIIHGKYESRPEGARRPTAGSEAREFTSRAERRRVPPLFERLDKMTVKLLVQIGLAAVAKKNQEFGV